MKVAFIGLGVMGFHMAGHLSKQGHDVTVYNRTLEKSQSWSSEFGGEIARTPKHACENAEVAVCCVGDDPDVEAVVMGSEGMLSGLSAGAVIVDHTTTSATLARSLNLRTAEKSIEFLDAPVSGGEAGAKSGQLTIMCGGTELAFQKCEAVLAAYGARYELLGPSGSGQMAKMVNQICIAGLVQGLSEGIAFGLANDLDMPRVIDVIAKGAAQSWQMDNRATTMIDGDYDFGFAVDWMRKDLRICMDQAEAAGASLPVATLVDQFYAEIQSIGGGRWDTSSLVQRLKK